MNRKILYLRNFSSKVNMKLYNLQEIGLCKSLVHQGFDCDIVYYTDSKELKTEVIHEYSQRQLRLLWMPAIKFLSNSVFLSALKKEFLQSYDLVITTEYNQVMTYLLSRRSAHKLALYHGPYQDNDRTLIQKVYDRFFLPTIIHNVDYVFAKSSLSEAYLRGKGFDRIHTLGVGLDRDNLTEDEEEEQPYHTAITERLQGTKAVLYVGRLEERRNIIFLFNVFRRLLEQRKDLSLVLVGDGAEQDKSRYFQHAKKIGIARHIIHYEKIEQRFIKYIYRHADVFVFPTRYDIFGMVLLESMYFKVPVVSSHNGGAATLIENRITGILEESFDEAKWAHHIAELIDNDTLRERLTEEAYRRIEQIHNWEAIGSRLLDTVNLTKVAGSQS